MPAVARPGFTGRYSSIGTVPTRIVDPNAAQNESEGVQLLASSGNSENIWVGYGSGITANVADSTDGFPLAPGASIFVPTRRAADIWVCSTSASGQVLWFLGQ